MSATRNPGGFPGSTVLSAVEKRAGSFAVGLHFLCVSMAISSAIIFFLWLRHKEKAAK